MNYLEIANSPIFWILCVPGVLLVIFLALKFGVLAFRDGQEMGIKRETLIIGARSAFITSIGPSFAILIAMLALIITMGAPFAWMRLSIIGAPMFELVAANYGAMAVGTEIGSPDFAEVAFASAVWAETLGTLGWIVVAILITHKLPVIRTKIVGKNIRFLPILTIAAMLGAFSYLTTKYLVKGFGSAAAVISGIIIMVFLLKLADRLKMHWIKEWSLGISMLIAMFIGSAF